MKKTRGRKAIKEGVETGFVGFKFPKDLTLKLENAVSTLKTLGYEDADMSKLVRALVEYRISNAVVIYRVKR